MSEAHEKTRIRQLEDAGAHWEHKYANARQYNRSLEERIGTLTAEVMHYTTGTPHPLEAELEKIKTLWHEASSTVRLQGIRIRELEAELAISKGREEGKQRIIEQLEASLRDALTRTSLETEGEQG